MKNNEFKEFIKIVENAGYNDPIWGAGFAFMNLTQNQHNKMWDVLNGKGFPHEVITNQLGTFDGVRIPTGLVLLK